MKSLSSFKFQVSTRVKRLLYRRLSFDGYLKVLSAGFFAGLRLGLGRRSAAYEYPRFLKNIVRRADIVIDIGANLGYYSRVLSRLVGDEGKVYAVEPVKPILRVLKHNLRCCPNVEIIPYALGGEDKSMVMINDSSSHAGYMGTGRNRVPESDDERGGMELPSSQDASTACGDGRRSVDKSRGFATRFEVDMRRGSELFAGLERLDFIKCDIEGYEGVVIPEIATVIQRHLPVVLLETGGALRRQMIELFRGWGYAGYVLQNGHLTSVMRAPEKDIFFIPGHRHSELI